MIAPINDPQPEGDEPAQPRPRPLFDHAAERRLLSMLLDLTDERRYLVLSAIKVDDFDHAGHRFAFWLFADPRPADRSDFAERCAQTPCESTVAEAILNEPIADAVAAHDAADVLAMSARRKALAIANKVSEAATADEMSFELLTKLSSEIAALVHRHYIGLSKLIELKTTPANDL